jgi:hypothetical protein
MLNLLKKEETKSKKQFMSNKKLAEKSNEHGSSGDSVLIKETGEQSTIKTSYGVFEISLEIKDIKMDSVEKEITENWFQKYVFKDVDKISEKPGWHYHLENGKKVHEDDVIVGKEEIRDFKINQIDGIQ